MFVVGVVANAWVGCGVVLGRSIGRLACEENDARMGNWVSDERTDDEQPPYTIYVVADDDRCFAAACS